MLIERKWQEILKDNNVVNSLNFLLQPIQAEYEKNVKRPVYPVIFVIGAPRTGTTLASQFLTADGLFARITNFVARFWLAPAVGAQIEQKLEVKQGTAEKKFVSVYGRTEGWSEPHEFGFFWDRWFKLGQETHKLSGRLLKAVNKKTLQASIASLETIYKRPILFKNNTWCTLQASWLANVFPTAIFVVCRRNILYTAQSLLLARRKLLQDEKNWWSIKPSNYNKIKDLPVYEQVILQAKSIEEEMDKELAKISDKRIVIAPYSQVCKNPQVIVNAVVKACAQFGFDSFNLNFLVKPFSSTDHQILSERDWIKLNDAAKKYKIFKGFQKRSVPKFT